MEIVTGDRYLDMLARFVEQNVAALLDGSTLLKLNPLGLHYLQARLDSLQELERLHMAAPVDYLRAYIADLGDHRALELLRRVLRLLGSVKVVSVLQASARDPTPITLLPFEHLRSLELRGCDLSTSAARGLLQLRPHLEKLVCHNSTDALRHVFAERMVEIQNLQVWSRLVTVSCACNAIPVMDESLQLLPVVEVLDLRRNRLTHVSSLGKCNRLRSLDLGFNWIQSVSRISQVASSLTTLVLRFNALSSTRGIERLYQLRALDLSHNIVSNFRELERLGRLRFITSLNLQANPITFACDYRVKTFSVFCEPDKLCLDGKHMSRVEKWKVQRLIAKRFKKDGGFGSYVPALTKSSDGSPVESDSEELVAKAKKKNSRLAVITDDRELPMRVDQTLTEDANTEAKVQQILKRLEVLKKDKSTLWLMKIPKLFENDAGTSQEESSSSSGRHKSRQGRRRKRESSIVQESSYVKEIPEEIISSNPVLSSLIDQPVSLGSPRSPPHFNREVLQRRQNLEEELLHVRDGSAEFSYSDSSTSTEFEGPTLVLEGLQGGQGGNPSASNPLLVEDDSCFSNPMWIGSALDVDKDKTKIDQPQDEQMNGLGSRK